jgi:aconitate hydratase
MPLNVAQKLITAHLVDGSLRAGTPITLKIDQTLTQDATGTLVMLTLEGTFVRCRSLMRFPTISRYLCF